MDVSIISALAGGLALGLAGTAIWYGFRGLDELFDLATGMKGFDR
ncbi:hypothetical protein [Sphingomonas sp.]|nr:hypothetical protein [Sphingomonas sp.]